ncbi:hypothetical protein [Marinibacterium sp. SX1]|uniref:hypothetical protein n=1 Tax=Marinibacterium sp. SX1 TaxID=3388424 RepID=UPI003D181ED1
MSDMAPPDRPPRSGASVLVTFGVLASVVILLSVAAGDGTDTAPAMVRNITPEAVAQAIGAIVLLAALIERAVEVAMVIAFGPAERDMSISLLESRARTAAAAEALETLTEATAEVSGATSAQLNDAAQALNAETGKSIEAVRISAARKRSLTALKTRAALSVSLLLASVLAVGGVNLVKTLFMTEFTGWMLSVELSVTALVLAGGAEGVHQVFKQFLSYRAGS